MHETVSAGCSTLGPVNASEAAFAPGQQQQCSENMKPPAQPMQGPMPEGDVALDLT
mgnify:CR=1 FL=1